MGASDVEATAAQCPRCAACGGALEPTDRFCEFCGADPLGRPSAVGDVPSCVACQAATISPEGYCEQCGRLQPGPRDHIEIDLGVASGVSDRGRRHRRNEDALALRCVERRTEHAAAAVVAVVCDGVSSSARSDEAAEAAAEAGAEALSAQLAAGVTQEEATREAAAAALSAVIALAGPFDAWNAPACTYVSAVATPASVTLGWLGDSRAYWVSTPSGDGAARSASCCLTVDDSWATAMVTAGALSEAEARADARAHRITAWLGEDAEDMTPHVVTIVPDGPGLVVLCTDGLWNYAETAEQLAALLPPDAAWRPIHAAQVLVRTALEAGGHDNVTVAVLPFPARRSPPPDGDGAPSEREEPAG